jgi:hypothetical protein
VIRAFDAAEIPYALLKSAALLFSIYALPEQRYGEDFDLVVAQSHLAAARRVLERLCYEPAQWSEATLRYQHGDPELRALVEARHYELVYLVRRERVHGLSQRTRDAVFDQLSIRPWLWYLTPTGNLATYMVVDVHHGLALDIPADALLATRCTAELDGTPTWVPLRTWSTFHINYKLYWDGVHLYADLIRLAPTLNAADVVELDPAMDALIDLCAVPNLRSGALEQNDCRDVWPKLWGRR